MPRDMLIRNVPDSVYAALRDRAAQRGRSLQAEALDALSERVRFTREEFLALSAAWAGREGAPQSAAGSPEEIARSRESRTRRIAETAGIDIPPESWDADADDT